MPYESGLRTNDTANMNRDANEPEPKDPPTDSMNASRVGKIESSLHELNASVDRVLRQLSATQSAPSPKAGDQASRLDLLGETEIGSPGTSPLPIGSSHAFSSLRKRHLNWRSLRISYLPPPSMITLDRAWQICLLL